VGYWAPRQPEGYARRVTALSFAPIMLAIGGFSAAWDRTFWAAPASLALMVVPIFGPVFLHNREQRSTMLG
jgi:hypothetical protein